MILVSFSPNIFRALNYDIVYKSQYKTKLRIAYKDRMTKNVIVLLQIPKVVQENLNFN